MLHIKIDGKPYCSPYPVFFADNVSKVELIDTKAQYPIQKNNSDTSFKPDSNLIKHSTPSSIESKLDKVEAHSHWIEALDLPALITVNQLHDLFCLYGEPITGNYKKEYWQRHVFLNFEDFVVADKSLLLSGIPLGGKVLFVKKWLEPHCVKKAKNIVNRNSIRVVSLNRHHELRYELEEESRRQALGFKKRNWQLQHNLLENYVAVLNHNGTKLNSPRAILNCSPLLRKSKEKNDIISKVDRKQMSKTFLLDQRRNKQTTFAEWNLL